MKYFVFSLFLISSTLTSAQTFHSLDGIENPQGETILLYRLGSDYFYFNPVYKLNTSTFSEELIIQAYDYNFPQSQLAKAVLDFEFFPSSEDFVNCGFVIYPDNHSYIARNDSIVFGGMSGFDRIDISKQNPLKVFAFAGGPLTRSFDGGYTYPEDSIGLITNFNAISLADFDDNVLFGIDYDNQFAKNAVLADTSKIFFDQYTKLLYDVNQFHIYRVNRTYGGYVFSVSNNKGDAYTWTKTYQSENPLFITIDSLQSGTVYLSDGRRIYKSTNNGYTFTLYKSLISNMVGLYKKSGGEILYAATSYKIYKITPDDIIIIKSLPIPPEVFDYYPLATGNKWIYDRLTIEYNPYPIGSQDIYVKEVWRDSIASNGKRYYLLNDESIWNNFVLERIDSVEAKVFRYDENLGLPDDEYVIDDLLAEVNDTVFSYRMFYWEDGYTTVLDKVIFEKWGLNKPKKVFEQYMLHPPVYSLTQGIGLDSIYFYFDFGYTIIRLKGCIINGVVYGDTSLVVGVEDEKETIPTEYKLYQNYPNPFNPVTKIKYTIPTSPLNPSPYQGEGQKERLVTLKVYDVLGKEVAILVNEEKPAGNYEVEFPSVETHSNASLTSGVYFCRLQAGSFVETKKMILLK